MSEPSSSRNQNPESAGLSTSDAGDWDRFRKNRRRKLILPLFLFFATIGSTFWVGITTWDPTGPFGDWFTTGNSEVFFAQVRELTVRNWSQGLIYAACVLAILLVHELGHFIATIIYRIPATAPIFLPFPFNPIGTLGAIIAMQSMVANRKQIFDIGIAGPLAGLVVALPIAFIGIAQLDLTVPGRGSLGFECPLLFRWMIGWMGVEGYVPGQAIWLNQLNPYFAAAWVGFLITGLNMFPVGQLDGGHVTYTLFGKYSYYVADGAMVLWIAFMIYFQSGILILMVILLIIFGTHHPPTANDKIKLGWFRMTLGILSLSIPVLCFPPKVFSFSF